MNEGTPPQSPAWRSGDGTHIAYKGEQTTVGNQRALGSHVNFIVCLGLLGPQFSHLWNGVDSPSSQKSEEDMERLRGH